MAICLRGSSEPHRNAHTEGSPGSVASDPSVAKTMAAYDRVSQRTRSRRVGASGCRARAWADSRSVTSVTSAGSTSKRDRTPVRRVVVDLHDRTGQRCELLLHGQQDTTIPISDAHRLHAQAPDHTTLLILPEADHDSVEELPGARPALLSFLHDVGVLSAHPVGDVVEPTAMPPRRDVAWSG